MLMCGTDVLCDAATRRTAVAGFVAYNLEMAQGVVEAARAVVPPAGQDHRRPVEERHRVRRAVRVAKPRAGELVVALHDVLEQDAAVFRPVRTVVKLGEATVVIL